MVLNNNDNNYTVTNYKIDWTAFCLWVANPLTKYNKKDREIYYNAKFDRSTLQFIDYPTNEEVTNHHKLQVKKFSNKKSKPLVCYFGITLF